ncbi:MAG TPA: hypothetical protein GX713_00415 [Mollicutes bacterium]|nr:hypothetical protein [Mollicutes bacterium]
MAKQDINKKRTKTQNNILDLEKLYMDKIEQIITSKKFLEDLKRIEAETQEYYTILQEIWGKKNKIKEASERLIRYYFYDYFKVKSFYPTPISCDVAIELNDVVLNVDVKTIDKVGNSGEINTTQFEHNQTSFINKNVDASGSFPGFKIKSNLRAIDPRTNKPLLTYLIKILYADDGSGSFNFCNDSTYPTIVLTCLPNGILSNLFDNNLFTNFKNYKYYNKGHGAYYKPKYITDKSEYSKLTEEDKYKIIENKTYIPDTWQRISGRSKIGYYDTAERVVWFTVERKNGKHYEIFLNAVSGGDTGRYNDAWLHERYDSNNNFWNGQRKYFKLLKEETN